MASDEARRDRIARNEVLFREVNERIRDLGADDRAGTVLCLCECGAIDCSAELTMTPQEYAQVRADPLTFAVLPGHVMPDVEDVVEAADRFLVVRKHEEEALRDRKSHGNGGA